MREELVGGKFWSLGLDLLSLGVCDFFIVYGGSWMCGIWREVWLDTVFGELGGFSSDRERGRLGVGIKCGGSRVLTLIEEFRFLVKVDFELVRELLFRWVGGGRRVWYLDSV